ncbi:putative monooxygenase p33MONOX isoform X1 [Osmerus eperlanus]|uniref:putative monooxygenase p33MONOX isoform X1 n=1 Tax=Osmerus eperlanus TaxID=29151 RepID=UPI002E140A9C
MGSGQGDTPALESGVPCSLFGAISSSMGMARHTFTYDEALDAPMHSPPPDVSFGFLWKDPVIPQRKFKRIAEEDEGWASRAQRGPFEAKPSAQPPFPVVKTKASSLVNTLMIRQTQETLLRFEHRAGLTEAGYSPHKGLSAEETHFHRMAEGPMHKLRVPIGDKEERLSTSAQSTPSVTPCVTPSVTPCVTPSVTPCVSPCTSPYASPAPNRRNWFSLSPAPFLVTPELTSANPADMGGNEGGRGGAERWSLFGTRSSTDPGSETNTGFSLQSYFGLPKSTTMDSIKTQVSLMVDDPSNFNPPKIEISGIDAQRVAQRPHKLKPRDMNVLTPSGF